ncbi:MAG: VWA domain-containing protein [Candidatus Latescibacteria bacterium]|nr:VWA domain-containing protein [Candidatus Latescibacterota bacterium]
MFRLLLILAPFLGALEIAAEQPCYWERPEPMARHFVLVVDGSGSMAGEPLRQAVAGAQGFVDQLRPGDRAAVVAFDSDIYLLQELTQDRAKLKNALQAVEARGATVLYDAVARSAGLLLEEKGARIVVFLTDGRDTGSQFTLDNIQSMGLSEGFFIYGIGLGEVDQDALRHFTKATGGILETTDDPQALSGLYQRVLADFYQRYGDPAAQGGAYAVRSLPSGRPVRLGGEMIGRTPLKVDNVPPGQYEVEVVFERGVWTCQTPAQGDSRTMVDAREDDLGHDLWVVSRPHGAAVFLDGTYVGSTALAIAKNDSAGWGQRVKADPRQLRIPLVPPGEHQLRLLTMADFDFGVGQELTLDVDMGGDERVLMVNVLAGKAESDDGTVVRKSAGDKVRDIFDQLESETGALDKERGR